MIVYLDPRDYRDERALREAAEDFRRAGVGVWLAPSWTPHGPHRASDETGPVLNSDET